MTLFKYAFNPNGPTVQISAGVTEDGKFLLYLPGCPEPIRVLHGHPIEMNINVAGPSGPVVLTAEMSENDAALG